MSFWSDLKTGVRLQSFHLLVNDPSFRDLLNMQLIDNELDRRRVSKRRNRIETDAVTNETASV